TPKRSYHSAAPTRRTAGVTLFAGAVADHGKILALGAHAAGVALHDRLLAPVGLDLLRVSRFFGRAIREERLDAFACRFSLVSRRLFAQARDVLQGRYRSARRDCVDVRTRDRIGWRGWAFALRLGLVAHDLEGSTAHQALGEGDRLALIDAPAKRGVGEIRHIYMAQVIAAEIGDRKLTEHVVEDRGRVLDRVIADHDTRGFETSEGESLHILLKRHAILQAERDGDGEVVHHRPEGSTFLMHVDEDLAKATVIELASAQVDLVAADDGLLGVALAAVRQLLAVIADDALDHALDDLLRDLDSSRCRRLSGQSLNRIILILLIGDKRGVERLRQLRAIAVKRVGLQCQLPGQHVGVLAILNRCIIRHVARLGDRAGDEGLGCGQHADVAFYREIALTDLAARIGAIEDRQVRFVQVRRALKRHRTADVDVCGLDLLTVEAERWKDLERHVVQLLVG